MPHTEIRKTIGELKAELERTPRDTEALEKKLEEASSRLEGGASDALHELAESLRREAEEFEVEHPRVTALVNQIATALSSLGI